MYYQPKTLSDALALRNELDESDILAGGTDLTVLWNKRITGRKNIIDIGRLEELRYVRQDDCNIRIGALTTFSQLAESALLKEKVPALVQAVSQIGSPQIRNMGTIGGNVVNASPGADAVTVLTVLGAVLVLCGGSEKRCVGIEGFITGPNKTQLRPNEILKEIVFKAPDSNQGMCFLKVGRRNALSIARVNGACILGLDGEKVKEIRLAIGSTTPRPMRFTPVEEYLTGRTLEPGVLEQAGKTASEFILQKTGYRKSSEYKLPVVTGFTARLISIAATNGEV